MTTTPTPPEGPHADLDAITARADAATPGPWVIRDVGYVYGTVTTARAAESGYVGTPIVDTFMWPEHGPANQVFVAHAREDVSALVAEVRRLRAALSDSVPREQYVRTVDERAAWEHLAHKAERERDEALAVIEQVRAAAVVAYKGPDDTDASMLRSAGSNLDRGYELGGGNLKRTVSRVLAVAADILDQAPADALARLKAEAGAQALEEFADWLRDCDDLTDDENGNPKGAEPNDGYWNNVYEDHARVRAATLREGAGS